MADHARGERLRQLRSERGLSQEEIAHALGVTAKTYGAWERGGGINPANVRQVARYFKVTPGDLVTPEFEPGPPETVLSEEDSERLRKIEEKLDEILKRTAPPAAPEPPETQPAGDDEIPTDLPGGQDSEPESQDEDEDSNEAAG